LTTDEEFWSVVQVIVSDVGETAVATTLVMNGGVVNVTKVEFVDKLVPPGLLVDATSKSYVVPAVRPVSSTE
jgi:hypothetical protein